MQGAFELRSLSATGLANVVHVLLKAREHYTDVGFGTPNVRCVSDAVNDLLVGLMGTLVYSLGQLRLTGRRDPTLGR